MSKNILCITLCLAVSSLQAMEQELIPSNEPAETGSPRTIKMKQLDTIRSNVRKDTIPDTEKITQIRSGLILGHQLLQMQSLSKKKGDNETITTKMTQLARKALILNKKDVATTKNQLHGLADDLLKEDSALPVSEYPSYTNLKKIITRINENKEHKAKKDTEITVLTNEKTKISQRAEDIDKQQVAIEKQIETLDAAYRELLAARKVLTNQINEKNFALDKTKALNSQIDEANNVLSEIKKEIHEKVKSTIMAREKKIQKYKEDIKKYEDSLANKSFSDKKSIQEQIIDIKVELDQLEKQQTHDAEELAKIEAKNKQVEQGGSLWSYMPAMPSLWSK